VQSGEWPAHETKVPLFPYQREGMLHLAFTERALLADEMGLGKTIQAIAACALLHRLGQARRVLVVTPASLKTEWEEQIQRFTDLPYQLVFGARFERLKAYDRAGASSRRTGSEPPVTRDSPFFTIVNYEQMLADALEVNARLSPTSWCSRRPSASRTGAPKPRRPSNGFAAVTPSCSPARPSRTGLTSFIR
jgi:hypothetical protein